MPVQEQELGPLGYVKLGKNLWQNLDGYWYLRQGELARAEGITGADAKFYGVEVGKLPVAAVEMAKGTIAPSIPMPKPAAKASGLDAYQSKTATLNQLKGDQYNEARTLAEKLDDDLINAEIAGEVLEQFVYKFSSQGREVIGLTYAGIREIAKHVGRIEMESCDIVENPDSWIIKVRAKNLDNGVAMFGISEQAKMLKRKDGSTQRDEYALQKTVSKAQRNALRALVPEQLAIVLLKKWLSEKNRTH